MNLEFLFSNYDRGYSEIERTFNLFKCKNCGLIFIDPQPTSDELYQITIQMIIIL